MGRVTIRKFSDANLQDAQKKELIREMFERKLDGVWIPNKFERMDGVPIVVRAENQMGAMVTFGETGTEMEIQEGIAFRYREHGKISPIFR